jgi:hypothetical protein
MLKRQEHQLDEQRIEQLYEYPTVKQGIQNTQRKEKTQKTNKVTKLHYQQPPLR